MTTDARLLQYIERIENLNSERKALSEDISDVFKEIKSAGYDTSVVRELIKHRKKDAQKRTEQLELFDVYLAAVGML